MWNTATHYGLISRTLHCSIALLFFTNFLLGLFGEELAGDNEALEHTLLNAHTTMGILLVALVLLRIVLSKVQVQPAYPDTMTPLEIKMATLVKMSLNLLILLTAIAGMAALNTRDEPALFFGFPMPMFFGENAELHEAAEEAHELLAYTLMALVILHAAIPPQPGGTGRFYPRAVLHLARPTIASQSSGHARCALP